MNDVQVILLDPMDDPDREWLRKLSRRVSPLLEWALAAGVELAAWHANEDGTPSFLLLPGEGEPPGWRVDLSLCPADARFRLRFELDMEDDQPDPPSTLVAEKAEDLLIPAAGELRSLRARAAAQAALEASLLPPRPEDQTCS